MRNILLILFAGISYAMGVWAYLRAAQHLAPGVTLKDVAGPPLQGAEDRGRLTSLYTPRGLQLRRVGMVFLWICAVFLAIDLVSLMPIWPSSERPDTNQVFVEVAKNKPSIFLVWVAALVLAWLGFVGARFRFWLSFPVLLLVKGWSRELTGVFPGRHQELVGTAAERLYALKVWPAFIIVLIAAVLGVRSCVARAVRDNKPAEETPPQVNGSDF